MTDNFVVYAHYTSDTNRLFYVGEGRPERAYSIRHRNRHWKFVYRKHGFSVKILYNDLTKSQAENIETRLIKKLKNKNAAITNLSIGPMFKSHWLANAPKEIHPMFGKKRSNPVLAEYNRIHSGVYSHNYGKPRPDVILRNKTGSFKRRVKKVVCNETNIVYDSLLEASFAFGKSKNNTTLVKHLKGKRKQAFGFTWSYYLGE